MATKTKPAEAPAAAPAEPPQPTHGGVYELVAGQLKTIEGGPPQAGPAQAGQAEGEGA